MIRDFREKDQNCSLTFSVSVSELSSRIRRLGTYFSSSVLIWDSPSLNSYMASGRTGEPKSITPFHLLESGPELRSQFFSSNNLSVHRYVEHEAMLRRQGVKKTRVARDENQGSHLSCIHDFRSLIGVYFSAWVLYQTRFICSSIVLLWSPDLLRPSS